MTKTKEQIRDLCLGCSGPDMNPIEVTAGDVLMLLDEAERLRKDAERNVELRKVGAHLSNCAFNLAQRADRPLTLETAATLGRLREEWDAAIQESQP